MIIQNMIRTVTMTVIVKVPTVIATAEDMDTELNLMDPREYPKVCVNLQTDVRYNYSVWRLFLWQEEKTAHKKQQ